MCTTTEAAAGNSNGQTGVRQGCAHARERGAKVSTVRCSRVIPNPSNPRGGGGLLGPTTRPLASSLPPPSLLRGHAVFSPQGFDPGDRLVIASYRTTEPRRSRTPGSDHGFVGLRMACVSVHEVAFGAILCTRLEYCCPCKGGHGVRTRSTYD